MGSAAVSPSDERQSRTPVPASDVGPPIHDASQERSGRPLGASSRLISGICDYGERLRKCSETVTGPTGEL